MRRHKLNKTPRHTLHSCRKTLDMHNLSAHIQHSVVPKSYQLAWRPFRRLPLWVLMADLNDPKQPLSRCSRRNQYALLGSDYGWQASGRMSERMKCDHDTEALTIWIVFCASTCFVRNRHLHADRLVWWRIECVVFSNMEN